MRRLDILLIGQSQALNELALELEQHGHTLTRLSDSHALNEQTVGNAELLIDDGSLAIPALSLLDLGKCAQLSVRLGLGPEDASGLPPIDVLCRYISSSDQRLIARVPVADEASGNGQVLRLRVIAELVDRVALEVSRFSRDAEYFTQAATATPGRHQREESLLTLESLAYAHRLNLNAQPQLLQLGKSR